jgi:glycosyltransferase involved in cell wall biosynthesis
VTEAVELLPAQSQKQMADLFRRCQVLVSPSIHDGTPNTLLEGMACGCYPVAGDLESIREWITPGVNGQLTDPSEPQALAEAVIEALEQSHLREAAARHNADLIAARAEYDQCMRLAGEFYAQLVQG